MKLRVFFEKHFYVPFSIAIVVGLMIPGVTAPLNPMVLPSLILVLFLVFLKIDVKDVLSHIRNPALVIYVVTANLIVMPIITFFACYWLDREVALGMVILVALPSGVAAAAITEMLGGRTALTLVISVLTTVIVPFTMPLLVRVLFATDASVNYGKLFLNLFLIVVIPMLGSQVVKRLWPKQVTRTKPWYSFGTVCLLSVVIMAVIGGEAKFIRSEPGEVLTILAILYVVFFVLQGVGYFLGFWRPREDRLAISVSKMIMNNGLGIVIAKQCFSPKITLILVLSEIPWCTMTVLYRLYGRKRKQPIAEGLPENGTDEESEN